MTRSPTSTPSDMSSPVEHQVGPAELQSGRAEYQTGEDTPLDSGGTQETNEALGSTERESLVVSDPPTTGNTAIDELLANLAHADTEDLPSFLNQVSDVHSRISRVMQESQNPGSVAASRISDAVRGATDASVDG